MIEFSISASQIVGFCTFIGSIWGVYKIYKELQKPNKILRDNVEKHESYLKNDYERINEIEVSNQMILKCMLVIINHEITGNGIDGMKSTRDELQNFLINKN